MRLTLRTLLAYLDDVLDPADKEELAQKIESSDFAKDLVHQTRDSVRRLRLSAPQVIGTGMGMDPNTVAEYLDNALPPEQVGDYERICLESDVHLAETAACHHVLTMVLGEPAEVEPRSRQRMHMIPAEARERRRLRTEPAHSRSVSATTVSSLAPLPAALAPEVVRPPGPATKAVEIPEYLRTRSWWRSRGVLAALAAVLVIGTALYLVSDMMGLFGGGPDVAAVDIDAQSPPMVPDTQRTAEGLATITTPAPIESTTAPVPVDQAPGTEPIIATAPSVTTETTSAPAATVPAVVGTSPTATGQVATSALEQPSIDNPAASANTVGEPSQRAVTEPAPAIDSSAAIPPQTTATLETPAAALPPATALLDETPPVDPAASIESSAPATSPATVSDAIPAPAEGDGAPKGPSELGSYLSGKTVLLRNDERKGGWFRVEPRSAVVAGQPLLSLPEFRPQISLASGVVLDMSGGTLIMLSEGDESGEPGRAGVGTGVPTIEVLYGRIVLINPMNPEARVRLKAGTQFGEARIAQNATLAIEVERQYVPGNDPRKTPAPVIATLFAPSGDVTWTDAAGEVVVERPSRWTLVEGTPAELIADSAPPEWIDRESRIQRSEQRYGAPKIDERMTSDRPADIQLLEIFHGNGQRELKSLAAKSAMHIGEFTPFVDVLRDSSQRPNWKSQIEAVRSAMTQSPESADLVFKTLVDQCGRPAATDLYEMLCGYSTEQIGINSDQMKMGAVAKLINWLAKDSLDYRVLAVHDLWEITGKQLMPNPAEKNEAIRKQNIRRWRDRLEKGDLEVVKHAE